jgi:acetate kinase
VTADRRVLVLNCGSSSVKYRLLEPHTGHLLVKGLAERIGEPMGVLTHGGLVVEQSFADHQQAHAAILNAFIEHGPSLAEGLAAVGHRVVHGGREFSHPTVIDDKVLAIIDALASLAPLHNPANAAGIRAARSVLPDVPQVAVFDTAFHSTIPARAATYAVPEHWRTDHGVHRYGFHGTSHAYVSRETARLLGRPLEVTQTIVLHLGNGASACAVAGGRSIDTSMGFTPLPGLVMGTRSGDVDPALPEYLSRVAGMAPEAVIAELNSRSGLLGLAGVADVREVTSRAAAGDERARLALDVYCYRIRGYVGAYYAALGSLDAIAFTAGVGENSAVVRAGALAGLERLGISVDDDRNLAPGGEPRVISPAGAPVTVLVVPTDEEREIGRQALAVVERRGGEPADG